ncbi:Immunoglobulin E-set [Vigna unguiculata]|uniref:Immunoglobulin E-set n=1 Tax=Vigna unguiculata TaxID=3917 RepID=A0A4D6MJA1_VIGUN|nr:Immunoglobulin E-set [Vigna unguiculata]
MATHSSTTLYFSFCLTLITFTLSSFHAQARFHAPHPSFKYCDTNSDYAVKVRGVEILPDPVERGVPFTFKIPAYTPEPIESGDLIYEISYVGVEGPPATFLHDLCEETPCPVPAGNFMLVHTELLPPVTPPGTYNVQLTFKDHKEKLLTCIIFPFKIGAISAI